MPTLADSIEVSGRFARSANLERDLARPEPLEGYVLTARGLDVIERIATAAAAGSAGGAWSLTGPYGSGKSSLALLLDAVFGGRSQLQRAAIGLVDDASAATGDLIRRTHRRYGTLDRGFNRGLVTAAREPLATTVSRALHSAVRRNGPTPPPADWSVDASNLIGPLEDGHAEPDRRHSGLSPSTLVDIARRLAQDAPLLLIIDEFGKNLEAIRDSGDADPYLLQQLAEAGQGSGLPIFVVTLQHLSFEDCLAGADGVQRREWAKVQGRFEDVSFVDSPGQTRSLIGTVFSGGDERLKARIDRWARSHSQKMRALGIAELTDPAVIASCYPLHPLTALVLPELCSRYGQHERTLFSFLAGPHPDGAQSFLRTTSLPARGQLPSLGLDAVYDYFVASGALSISSARQSSRWTEIATRLRDSHGLAPSQARMAKAIALLNLVSTTGTIRASKQLLALAGRGAVSALADLESAGIVTYRDFADEYRIWHGSDVDLGYLLDAARLRSQSDPLAEIVSGIDRPGPVVAARHSAEHDMLRVFCRRYVGGGEQASAPEPSSPYDGKVLLVVDPDGRPPSLAHPAPGTRPVVAAIPQDLSAVDVAAREVAAVASVLDDPAVAGDRVARRELGERLAQTRVAFDHALTDAFGSEACRWILLGDEDDGDGLTDLPAGRGSAALSAAADIAYPSTPTIGNEMLNRSELTSQGAKSRRLLLEAMIESGDAAIDDLGFEGYGPETAMYRSFLLRTGLHSPHRLGEAMAFGPPADGTLKPAWEVLVGEFRRSRDQRISLSDIYAALMSPPIGMKAAVVPVLVTAGLLAFRDEVAIYEHGTFKPLLSPELSERMVRNPIHFDIKHFANTSGGRLMVVEALADRLGLASRGAKSRRQRVANVLAVVGGLVSRIMHLDNYSRHTRNVEPETLAVREALTVAVEPDELLFAALPEALGFDPIPAAAADCGHAHDFAHAVAAALDELDACLDRLLAESLELLLDTCSANSRIAVMGEAAALGDEVLDPEVRAFVLALANDGAGSDADWMAAVATVVARKAPAEWTDDDRLRFRRELPERLAAFHRLAALHAERRADGGGPFDALRVTVTRSDGSEYIRMVGLDARKRSDLESALDGVLADLAPITGSAQRAEQSLLALLGERLLPAAGSSTPDQVATVAETRRRAAGA
ncbi:MAG: hypothetical protein F4Z44_04170 [Gemmatimonadetes bacterium]|nr:hypothetical protein [Gemmatimonadota bacterium]MYE56770.1 hypothetical protein [Acidimicrobiaceae bacterium]